MDIQMPRLNGIQATALIKRFSPHVIVVGLSVHVTEDLRQEMITAGATSVLTKDHAGERLHEEITKAVGLPDRDVIVTAFPRVGGGHAT